MEKHWFAQGSGVDVSKKRFPSRRLFRGSKWVKMTHFRLLRGMFHETLLFFALQTCSRLILGGKGWQWHFLALIAVHVWKSRHRNNSDAFQNRLSGLNLTAEKAFDLKSAKTAKIHLPSRRLFPCPNGAPNGPIRKVPQKAPNVFKSISVFTESCKVRFLLEAQNSSIFHFPSRSLKSLRELLKI